MLIVRARHHHVAAIYLPSCPQLHALRETPPPPARRPPDPRDSEFRSQHGLRHLRPPSIARSETRLTGGGGGGADSRNLRPDQKRESVVRSTKRSDSITNTVCTRGNILRSEQLSQLDSASSRALNGGVTLERELVLHIRSFPPAAIRSTRLSPVQLCSISKHDGSYWSQSWRWARDAGLFFALSAGFFERTGLPS